MAKDYIDQREGAYWIAGTRVSLDSIVCAFLRGASPESIAQSFPVLTLEEVFGAITYYLAHQSDVDSSLRRNDQDFEALQRDPRRSNPLLYRTLDEARQHQHASRE